MFHWNRSCFFERNDFQMMSRYGAIYTGMGMKRYYILSKMLMEIKCHGRIIKQSVLAGLLGKYSILDNEIESERCDNKVNFICSKGCTDCCDNYFYVSQIEYFAIKSYLEKVNIDLNNIISKSKTVLERLKVRCLKEYNKLEIDDVSDVDSIYDDRKNILIFEPCIFLQNGMCSVYDMRPFICRLYGFSTRYVVCERIWNKSKNNLMRKIDIDKLRKYTIDIPYRNEYKYNVDYFLLDDGRENYLRQYPLFWWFAHDDLFTESYILAKSITVDEFIRYNTKMSRK